MQLRAARPDEAEFFYETRKASFREHSEPVFGPWDDAKLRPVTYAEFAALPVQIIELEGARIGYIVVEHKDDHWFLDEIAIAAEHRNRGLGTKLVKDTMVAARAASMSLRLSVLHVNPAQRLYERLGFRVTRIEHPRVKMEWP